MGKGLDPNCAIAVPMSVGEEEIIIQPRVNKLRTRRVSGDLFLVRYEPGTDEETSACFVLEQADYHRLRNSDDPTRSVLTDRTLRRFRQYTEPSMKMFSDVYYRDLEGPHTVEDMSSMESPDPDRLLHWDGANFFVPGSKRPKSKVERLELFGARLDLDRVQAHLLHHPWVRQIKVCDNPIRENWSIIGKRRTFLDILIPQNVHDQYWDALSGDENHLPVSCPNILQKQANYGIAEMSLPDDMQDPLNIRQFAYASPEQSPDYEEDPWF